MSKSQRTIDAEAIAKRLATIDAHRLHSWLIRSTELRHQDLIRSWSAAVTTPREIELGLDVDAFIDWCAAGVELFLQEGLPSRRNIDDAAHRVMLAAVLRRHASISAASSALETSRRALRAAMKRLGIYEAWQQWRAGKSQPKPAERSDSPEPVECMEPSGTDPDSTPEREDPTS